jgi:hypothetical protein
LALLQGGDQKAMATVTGLQLGGCDAYRVLDAQRLVGLVEEIWLGPAEEPTAVVVRLLDRRRGLLRADDVAAVFREDDSLTLSPSARLLQLDAPHLERTYDRGTYSATWHTNGEPLLLPEPPGPERPRRLERQLSARAPQASPLVWQPIAKLYGALAAIVASVIGLDILIAYLAAGAPPY